MAKVGQWRRVVGRTAGVLTQLIALVGCTGGQTGEDSYFPCIVSTTPISIDTVSPLGFSASQVLAYAAGKHDSTVRWHEFHGVIAYDNRVTSIPAGGYSPGGGEAGVAFTIHYGDGAARFVHQQPVFSDDARSLCRDWLEVGVTASLATSDGALDESFDTTLFAFSAWQAEWWARLPLSNIHGSFRVTPSEPLVTALRLRGGVTPEGSFGHLSNYWDPYAAPSPELDATKRIRSVDINYGDWPPGPPCDGAPVPLDARLEQFSANDALELINTLPTMSHWQWSHSLLGTQIATEANLTLRVSPRGPTACANTGFGAYMPQPWGISGPRTLTLLGQLNATTDDGSVNIQLPVKLEAWPDAEGSLYSVTLAIDSPFDTGVSPSDLDGQYSFVDGDSSRYDAISCTLELGAARSNGGVTFVRDPSGTRAQGRLIVWGHTGASCIRDASNPGCLINEIEGLYWYPPSSN